MVFGHFRSEIAVTPKVQRLRLATTPALIRYPLVIELVDEYADC